MSLFSTFLIAVSLAMDAFAVALSNGIAIKNMKKSYILKFGLFFGGFQFAMTLIGYFLGSYFTDIISAYSSYVAFILLTLIGIGMLRESDDEVKDSDEAIVSTKNIVLSSIATSIDALAVGVSFVALGEAILIPSIIIGVVAFCFGCVGVYVGNKFGGKLGKYATKLGGTVLIILGIKALLG